MRPAIRRPGYDSTDGSRLTVASGRGRRPLLTQARGALALAAMTLSLSACAEMITLRDDIGSVRTGLASAPGGLTRNVVRHVATPSDAPTQRSEPAAALSETPAPALVAQSAIGKDAASLSAAADAFSSAADTFERHELSYGDSAAETPLDPFAFPEAAASMRPLSLEAPQPESPAAPDVVAQADLPGPRVPAGIYGTVTDAEKLIVNGIKVETAGARPAGLDVGDVVAIEGTEVNGFVNAASIEEIHALIGPLSDDIPLGAAHELTVMGVPVTLSSGATIVDRETENQLDSFSLTVGDRLAVSGLWQDGAVIANRIERLSDSGPDEIAGALRHVDSTAYIGPLAIDGAPTDGTPEQFARVSGRYDNGRFVASDVAVGVPRALAIPGARLSIEGFLRSNGSSGMLGYRIDGLAMPLDPEATPSVQVAGGRAILIGESGDAAGGLFKAKQGVPLPNAFVKRLEILSTINDGFEPHNASPLR